MNRKKWIWNLLSLALAACSIWVVASLGRGVSGEDFLEMLRGASPFWMACAVLCMLGFIVFEACALRCVTAGLGHGQKHPHHALSYAAADIYLSAITPSATGGQPASAYFMLQDGIPAAVVTVSLLMNLLMYTAAVLVVGLVCFVLRFDIFLLFSGVSKALILIGCALLLLLGTLFVLLLRHPTLIRRIAGLLLRLLRRLHLLRHPERSAAKLEQTIAEYQLASDMIVNQRRMLTRLFVWNLLQRLSQISVPMMAYLATGGSLRTAPDIWVMQSYVTLGSNCVPIPGGMGVADYLMLDGFSAILPSFATTGLELLSRGISFYCCVLICGVIFAVGCIKRKKEREF